MNVPSKRNPKRVMMRLKYSEPRDTPHPYIQEEREKAPSPDINIIQQQLNVINLDQSQYGINKSQRVIQTLKYSQPPISSIKNNNNGSHLEIREKAPSPDINVFISNIH